MIRKGTINDLEELALIEKNSYPEEEAASLKSIERRLKTFADCFWILEEDKKIVSFINGMMSDYNDLSDEMYEKTELHNEKGDWLMIFSVVTKESERGKGYAKKVMEQVIKDVKGLGKEGIVLTCKERLVSFYKQFGFVNEGVSRSVHGGAIWYQMRLRFEDTNE